MTEAKDRKEILALIQDSKLGPQDEVCAANHYWFFLHEQKEVEQQLGIKALKQGVRPGTYEDDEITETQTETLETESGTAGSGGRSHVHSESGSTMMKLSKRPATERRPGAAAFNLNPGRPIPTVSVSPQIESSSIWRGFAWLLLLCVIGVVIAVLRVLSTSG
jgi:hypothetical protein